MKLSPKKRWAFWGISLAAAVALVATSNGDRTDSAASVVAEAAPHPRHDTAGQDDASRPTALALGRLNRIALGAQSADLFRHKSWYVPPPPPPPAPPPRPTTPPLPFRFIGKVRSPQGKLTIFIADQSHVYLIHGGETLHNTYHVDGFHNGKLALTYLPLHTKQYLDLTGTH